MRVGIFGGTFDPVHFGHLRAAEEIREQYSLDKVYFVPAYIPPHKMTMRITDPDLRLKMLKAALRGNGYLRASEVELRSKGVSYSINTIKAFEKQFESLYFIIGIDAFFEIDTWHDYQDIFNHTNFIIMGRPIGRKWSAYDLFPPVVRKHLNKVNDDTFEHRSGKKIHMQTITQLDISSTKIRDYAKNNRSIKYLVPRPVEKMIEIGGLYKGLNS